MEGLDSGVVPFGNLFFEANREAAAELILTVQVLQKLHGRREGVKTHNDWTIMARSFGQLSVQLS